jgi:DedD protein
MATGQSARTRHRAADSEDGAGDSALPQKKRARHRLIGAIALCLVALVVVPLLLESEPSRPASDLTIAIPSRDTPLPARQAADARGDAGRNAAVAARGTIEQSPDGNARPATDTRSSAAKAGEGKSAESRGADAKSAESKGGDAKSAEAKGGDAKGAEAKGADAKGADAKATESKSAEAKAADTKAADAKAADTKAADAKAAEAKAAEARRDSKPDEIQRLAELAQARARGETVGRYLLQVGAFASQASANAAAERVTAAGQRGFTEKIKTDRGERVRVRVGPFPSREAAEQAREKLKAAGIEAAVIAP